MLRTTLLWMVLIASPVLGQAELKLTTGVSPTARGLNLTPIDELPAVQIAAPDRSALAAEDDKRRSEGAPPRYAVVDKVELDLFQSGLWEQVDDDFLLWRLRVVAPLANNINLGFTRYELPPKSRLLIHDADDDRIGPRPFTELDNASHGELWTPPVPSDEVVIELTVPVIYVERVDLSLTHIGYGYRHFGLPPAQEESGACNVDVVCAEADGWQDEIASVAVISLGGGTFCSGFMVNNTSNDRTPYFMTGDHCGVSAGNAASLVVFWNYQNSTCRPPGSGASGGPGNGSLNQFQTGSFFRASYAPSDFTLVELDSDPLQSWNVTFAGWNRGIGSASSAVAIHHPSTDEKRISFENQATSTTSYFGGSVPGDGTHVRVLDWDLGTTEGGSSGSPLFDQNHRVIGQLHGGLAACGNNDPDWYGRFFRSWSGGGTASSRLSNWLDPTGTGLTVLDTLSTTAIEVTPGTDLDSAGTQGGPFSPVSRTYFVDNVGVSPVNYLVSTPASWVSITNPSGTLAGGTSSIVTVSINGGANSLPPGQANALVTFANTTNGVGDTTRLVSLDVSAIGGGGSVMVPSTDTPIAIPDAGVTTSTITVSGLGAVQVTDLDVLFDVTHTWVGDLIFTLSHGGTSVTLIDRPGYTGSGFGCDQDNFAGIDIDDGGTGGSIESACSADLASPPAYTPNNPLAAFNGLDPNGDWVLTVSDNAGQDTGTLEGWTLDLVTSGGGTPDSFCDASDGSLASCPCSNPGAPGTGCDIQQATGGVILSVVSQESSPQNRATLAGNGYPVGSLPAAVVIRAPSLDPASPVSFGDGLRCIGVPLVRLAGDVGILGSSTHTFGHGTMAGSGTFYYQLWFRNTPAMFCTPDAFNLSNGRTLSW